MNRLQIRQEVREILRDEGYPADAINRAINRVIREINVSGRYRFHQSSRDITLTVGFFGYGVDTDILAEELVEFDPDTTSNTILTKYPSFLDAVAKGAFTTEATKPTHYTRWADKWLFDPMPNSAAGGKKIRIYFFEDLDPLTSDLEVPRINERYHTSVIAAGAAAEIRPSARTGRGDETLAERFTTNFVYMKNQELWEPLANPQLHRSLRWRNISQAGSVGSVR